MKLLAIGTMQDQYLNRSVMALKWWHSEPEMDVHNNNHPTTMEDANLNETMDISNTSFINELWIVADTSEIIIKTSAFLPVAVWGIFGNILLLYIIIRNRHLWSPTNMLIANMAAADLLTLLIHPWVFLVYDFFQNYQLGAFGCKAEGGIECAILLASVMNLLAISYDRLTAIVLPQETRLTRYGANIVMIVTWVVSFVLASPLFFYRTYKERQWLDFLEKYCTEDTIVINIYWHVIITMLVWLPLTIILICYITIFIKLDRYEHMVLRKLNPRQVSYKKKVARMMFVVVVTFMACRLPFTALIFYRNQLLKNNHLSNKNQVQNQVNGLYHTLWFISKYLIFMNAALNPVIYGLTNERFRNTFKTSPLSKWIFACDSTSKPKNEIANRNLKTENNNTASNSNKSKIFLIFKAKLQIKANIQDTETSSTNSGPYYFNMK